MASLSFVTVKPEFADVVNRLSPHLPALERLAGYFRVESIIYVLAWIALFPTSYNFDKRRKRGPIYLLILLAVQSVVYAFGAVLTLPLPADDTEALINVFSMRVAPFVPPFIMLTLIPFFGKTASIFYQYTAIDSKCFKKKGIARQVLEERKLPDTDELRKKGE